MKILLFPLLLSAITSISPEARFQVYQELHAKHPYQVILSKIPVFKESEDSITLPLKSLDTKYVCTIPPPEEENPKEKPIKRRGKDVEQRKVDWALSKLQTMKGGCITSTQQDWAYEFCAFDYIRQYYTKVEGYEYRIGNYIEETSGTYFSPYGLAGAELVNTDQEPYFRQYYIDGTFCKASGVPRVTEVRFSCCSNEHLSTIAEHSTCFYILEVHTPLMCDYFETFQEEDMIAENNYIVCSPLLSEKERQATVKMEEEKAEELNGIRLIDFDKSKCTSPMQCSINEGDWVPVAYKQRKSTKKKKQEKLVSSLLKQLEKRSTVVENILAKYKRQKDDNLYILNIEKERPVKKNEIDSTKVEHLMVELAGKLRDIDTVEKLVGAIYDVFTDIVLIFDVKETAWEILNVVNDENRFLDITDPENPNNILEGGGEQNMNSTVENLKKQVLILKELMKKNIPQDYNRLFNEKGQIRKDVLEKFIENDLL